MVTTKWFYAASTDVFSCWLHLRGTTQRTYRHINKNCLPTWLSRYMVISCILYHSYKSFVKSFHTFPYKQYIYVHRSNFTKIQMWKFQWISVINEKWWLFMEIVTVFIVSCTNLNFVLMNCTPRILAIYWVGKLNIWRQ